MASEGHVLIPCVRYARCRTLERARTGSVRSERLVESVARRDQAIAKRKRGT